MGNKKEFFRLYLVCFGMFLVFISRFFAFTSLEWMEPPLFIIGSALALVSLKKHKKGSRL